MAQALGSVTDMVINGIFPWCFTPELYAARPEYIDSLAEFVRGRPMPPVDAFLRQSEAVLAHDAREVLGSIQAPTLITFGRHDMVTSTRFADPLTEGIPGSEIIVFDDCAHAPIYENVDDFNQRTLDIPAAPLRAGLMPYGAVASHSQHQSKAGAQRTLASSRDDVRPYPSIARRLCGSVLKSSEGARIYPEPRPERPGVSRQKAVSRCSVRRLPVRTPLPGRHCRGRQRRSRAAPTRAELRLAPVQATGRQLQSR